MTARVSRAFPFLVLALLVGVAPIFAQSTNSILTGSVTDTSGAAVPNVRITATNTLTGVAPETRSNESGLYLFSALQPGKYKLKAQADGFRLFVVNDVSLEVGARVKVDVLLEVGTMAETVEVQAHTESPLEAVTTSIGNVVSQQRVIDLPLAARDASTLVRLQAGVVGDNFSGLRIASQNVALDGINIQDARFQGGAEGGNLVVFSSVDRIAEFRVLTSPADAEFGRGSAQVQLITNSGGNEFHGGAFEFNRVTALSANTWFNNQRGRNPDGSEVTPRNFLVRNQFGAKVGGPVIRNKTFFFFLYEGQRQVTKTSVTRTTYTESARRGLLRFFPGVQNGNVTAAIPTVDLSGNPVRPTSATGDLQSINLFGRDPNRPAADPSGSVQKLMNQMPLPNDFRAGDGLNTGGYTWQRGATSDFDSYSLRLDHTLSSKHRLSFTYLKESSEAINGYAAQEFPTLTGGVLKAPNAFYSLSVVSTLRPNLLNEFRAGAQRGHPQFLAPWEVAGNGILPSIRNQPFYFIFTGNLTADPYNVNMSPQGRISPVYQISDSMTWLRGRHALKGGFEARFASTNGYNSFFVMPRAAIGSGAAPIQNVANIAGIGANNAFAQNMLNDLSGSLASFVQQFNSPGGSNPQFLAGEYNQRTWRQREYSFFFKDDWKVGKSLTLNLGLRYEYYGVPFEANGKSAVPVGGSGAVFGISGSTFGDLFQPGRASGSLTRQELVGRTTPRPDGALYAEDLNNFAPAVGLSWALPWFGANKTVLRFGYSVAYDRNLLRNVDIYAGDVPGLNRQETYRSSSYLDPSRLPVVQPTLQPLATVPLTDRALTLRAYDSGLRTPYAQNFNISLQRELTATTTLSVRYVGSKGTKLLRGVSVNEANIFENGILDAFRVTQAGGNAPLLDRIFNGFTVAGVGVVNGTTVTGSDYARSNATIQGQLANNNVGTFADFLNTSTLAGLPGDLLRRAGLPENFVVVNPQYLAASLLSNYANSTFHSMQIEVEKRFGSGWTYQGNYTWSKSLGEEEGAAQQLEDSYRTLRNQSLDKRRMSFHRSHAFKSNGVWELPFGRGKRFGRDVNGAVDRVIGGWRTGGILSIFSGQPFDLLAPIASFNQISADNTPTAVAALPKSTGSLTTDGNGVLYFADLRQIADPSIAGLTSINRINSLSALRAITDASGKLLLVNAAPGTLGSLAPRFLEGPGAFTLDLSLTKSVRLTEKKDIELRADFINATNTPRFGNPNANINSPTFGRITTAAGSRLVVLGARFNF